jgi:hypothetical protein
MNTIGKKDVVYVKFLFYGIRVPVLVVTINYDPDHLEEVALNKGTKNQSLNVIKHLY